jgi:hypothetical protein
VWILLQAGLRQRWRAWLALALLVGLLGGMVSATAAGARRTDTAFTRLLAWSNAPDAEIFSLTGGPTLVRRNMGAALARLPQVRASADSRQQGDHHPAPPPGPEFVHRGATGRRPSAHALLARLPG